MLARLDRRRGGSTRVAGSYIIGSGEDSIEMISRLGDISDLAMIGVFSLLEGASYAISTACMISRRGDTLACCVETDC
mgnify:CR=1 FL=1|jgi:hypothetical protein